MCVHVRASSGTSPFLVPLFLLFNLFNDMLYAIHGSGLRGKSVAWPYVQGRKRPGRLFQSTQVYDGQICLITGEKSRSR